MPSINHKRKSKTSKMSSKSSKHLKNVKRNKKTRSNIRKMKGGANESAIVYSFNEILDNINKVDEADEADKQTAKELFLEYIEKNKTNPSREIRYDIHLLCSIMSIKFNYNDAVNITINDSVINVNRMVRCCDKDTNKEELLSYYKEDIYTDDLTIFIREYDKFLETKKSEFFFKSNITNISRLLKCHYHKCFDDYYKKMEQFKKIKNMNKFVSKGGEEIKKILEYIFITFNKLKTKLITLLITAYNSCSYIDVCKLYISYIEFYYEEYKDVLETLTDNILNETYEILKNNIITAINNSNINQNYFVYLSCSHISESRQARFYMTRFVDSYIGGSDVHNGLVIDTLDIITHDLYIHGNLERITISVPDTYDNINRVTIMKLYTQSLNEDNNMELYNTGMTILQLMQNEYYKKTPIVFDKTLAYYTNIIEYFKKYSYNIFTNIQLQNFLKFIAPEYKTFNLKHTNSKFLQVIFPEDELNRKQYELTYPKQ